MPVSPLCCIFDAGRRARLWRVGASGICGGLAKGLCTMKPVDIVRLAGKVDKRALLLEMIAEADMPLVEQILAPMWKNLDVEYVRRFINGAGAGVRLVCHQRGCPTDKTLEVAPGTTIGQVKEMFGLGFFTVGGTPLVPFVNGERQDEDFPLRGGEVVEFKLP